MKKFWAILMAVMLVFTFTTALAGVEGELTGTTNVSVSLAGGVDVDDVDLVRVTWANTAGSVTANVSVDYDWDYTDTSDFHYEKGFTINDVSYVQPSFSVTVVNYSSPGHDYRGALTITADEFAQGNAWNSDSLSLAGQAAASVFGTTKETLTSAEHTSLSDRTKICEFGFDGTNAGAILNTLGAEFIADMLTNGSFETTTNGTFVSENQWIFMAEIAITAVD